ncbi:hypothetical protein IX39_04385 [Chryseobacterium formosense]|uniref:Uncharacterized protein n=1 Tax=Chryseobacterium formosense TaxID=236814 RepID=A0A085Z633_9FLAO|nr:hypothetical protein [Chryseobacterium formosense]KFE99896.1 hypothetical protein IX39_04385 [Chryseobacterium formosense]SFT59711.1 hypothetical protein SAMN05421857_1961 [Chryseobacterium formosense]
MVRITNYIKRQREDGTTFCVLEVQAGIEMVLSQKTNQYYVTAKKTFISSTFDEETCQALIGTQMQGTIIKQECEPYEYTIKDTGEVVVLNHRFVYSPQEITASSNTINASVNTSSDSFEADLEAFSKNSRFEAVLAD